MSEETTNEHEPAPDDSRAADELTAVGLRHDQQPVFEAIVDFLAGVASGDEPTRWGHVVLPPRTGKTVIAAHVLRALDLRAVFLVPTKVLVDQVVSELRAHAPGLDVGVYYGDEKRLVSRGVHVTTYATLTQRGRRWPAALREVDLVFVDEAHHAIASRHRAALSRAFAPNAARIGLTATPDYDRRRRLCAVFPRNIAHVDLREATRAGLLAPARVHIVEVDVDASDVELRAGEYDSGQLGRLLSGAPFLEVALRCRYASGLRDISCMIAATSRQQAHDVAAFLNRRRPPDRPAAQVVVGDTPREARARILRDFSEGVIDTVVQVGVLIEGWSEPRCKLLVDLAPSRSRVRATQKYFRALTRDGDRLAHLVVVLPRDLTRPPVLPMDLMMDPGDVWTPERILGGARPPGRIDDSGVGAIRGVRVCQRLLVSARLGVPTLSRWDREGLRAVLATCRDLDPHDLPGRRAFERMYFAHPLFSGTGSALLRWLQVPPGPQAWVGFLARAYPEAVADRLVGTPARFESSGPAPLPPPTPEEWVLSRERARLVRAAMAKVKPRPRRALELRFGVDQDRSHTMQEIGQVLGVSRERARQIVRSGLADVRQHLFNGALAESDFDDAARYATWHDESRLLALARTRESRGDLDRAVELLVRICRRRDSSRAHLALARLFTRRGAHLSRVVEELRAAALGRDIACRDSAREQLRAREQIEVALECIEQSGGAAWQRADLLTRVGRLDEAVAALERVDWYDDDVLQSILVRHRAGLPCGSALFRVATGPDQTKVRELQGLRSPTSTYAKWTLDAWQRTPDALQRLTWWQEHPEVRRAHDELMDAWSSCRYACTADQERTMREVRQRIAGEIRTLEAVDPLATPRPESVADDPTGSAE